MGAEPRGRHSRVGHEPRWKSAGDGRGENNQVRVWAGGQRRSRPAAYGMAGFTAPVKSVAFSLDNLHIASGTANNLVFVHDVKTAAIEQIFAEHGASARSNRWQPPARTARSL